MHAQLEKTTNAQLHLLQLSVEEKRKEKKKLCVKKENIQILLVNELDMFQKSCGSVTAGSCYQAEHDRGDAIIVAPTDEVNSDDIDCSSFDIVRATQFGAIERVRQLVEEEGADVNQTDEDTVTLLHWAAINNRTNIVRYLLDKAAIVDRLGGDLNSTPLHWATRQGHLASVVLLTNAGADPRVKDAEGCSCIHLAAQFGHTACVAYFIAREVPIDEFDTGGMTALMWAAWKISSLDPVRLMITLGANPNLQDATHSNTALHWAILARNARAIWSLVINGKASLDIRNSRGDTSLQLLQQHIGSKWIHYEVAEKIKDITQRRSTKTTLLMKIVMSERIKFWTLVTVPLAFLFSVGLILATNLFFLFKIVLIGLSMAFISICKRLILNEDQRAQLPLYFYWASKAFFYVSWIFFIGPVVSTLTTVLFVIINVVLWITFMVLWKGDCGVIKLSKNQQLNTILELAETTLETGKNAFDPSSFCSGCLVKKPMRSKHCSVCDRCVGVSSSRLVLSENSL